MTPDEKIIEDPDKWRHWPILPLVNVDGRAAFIVSTQTKGKIKGEIHIWQGNMWNARAALTNPRNRITYPNAQMLINDGWRVD